MILKINNNNNKEEKKRNEGKQRRGIIIINIRGKNYNAEVSGARCMRSRRGLKNKHNTISQYWIERWGILRFMYTETHTHTENVVNNKNNLKDNEKKYK